MNPQTAIIYEFGPFRLDQARRILLRDGQIVTLNSKGYETLLMLVQNRNRVVGKNEILEALWPDAPVDENNINQAISALRAVFGEKPGENKYIRTVPGYGYRFVANVTEVPNTDPIQPPEEEQPPVITEKQRRRPNLTKTLIFILCVALLLGLIVGLIIVRPAPERPEETSRETPTPQSIGSVPINSPADELEVRRVVKDSQVYEFFTIYTNPKAFDKSNLRKYWVPAEQNGREIEQVETSIERLLNKGWRYGKESEVRIFDIRRVQIFEPGDYAEVETREQWFLPLYKEDGTRVLERRAFHGPYRVNYILRKINGTWLIQETTTPRAR